jgi:hypothetical protein
MTDLAFSYAGRDLIPLLSKLLESHAVELQRLEDKLKTFSAAQIEAAKSPQLGARFETDKAGNIKPKSSYDVSDAAQTIHARDRAWLAHRETELWLIECYRTPSAQWHLGLKDLAHLYPEQTAPETLGSFRARSIAPVPFWYRLFAVLAGWLWPRRQALPLLAQGK